MNKIVALLLLALCGCASPKVDSPYPTEAQYEECRSLCTRVGADGTFKSASGSLCRCVGYGVPVFRL